MTIWTPTHYNSTYSKLQLALEEGLSVNYESLSRLSFFSKVCIFICIFFSFLYEISRFLKKKKVLHFCV
jgi:hypothetical protein